MKVVHNSQHWQIKSMDMTSIPRLFMLQLPDKDLNIGHALCFHDGEGKAILWHIWIDPLYRRKGYASHLIKEIQAHFKEIATDSTSSQGLALCLKSGLKKRDTSYLNLFWKKEAPNEPSHDHEKGRLPSVNAEPSPCETHDEEKGEKTGQSTSGNRT